MIIHEYNEDFLEEKSNLIPIDYLNSYNLEKILGTEVEQYQGYVPWRIEDLNTFYYEVFRKYFK